MKALVLVVIVAAGFAAQAQPPASASSPAASAKADGRALYTDTCALCHMADGKGEAGMQPPLVGSARLSGDANLLIDLILRGPKAVLPPSKVEWASEMPELPDLSDQEIAAVLTFARKQFGRGASPVTPAQVAAQRKKHGIPPVPPAK